MRNIKLTIEYDGSNYVGWQIQENGISIQEEMEGAIHRVTGEDITLIGSGRTDSGVHAMGQVANFKTSSTIPANRFKFAINNNLPGDIVILRSEEVPMHFHSRYDAIGKRYRYMIYNSRTPTALYRNLLYHVSYDLNYDEMQEAVDFFKGTHDFTSFMVARNYVETAVRTITDISLDVNGGMICLIIEGNGFLYNMVRIIAGTIVDIGRGKLNAADIPDIIDSKHRKAAGHTAPSQGLYLERVYYPK
ncbi:MAG: tRNA pseudouridine(38-40) synthase TruA [Tissierellia bacterium]|nr:tRNA pseudouridine(38-40) synthase TruA [Tissierellia bacterium]